MFQRLTASLLAKILSEINPYHVLTHYIFKIHFNIIILQYTINNFIYLVTENR
jgi:hypothetical protein